MTYEQYTAHMNRQTPTPFSHNTAITDEEAESEMRYLPKPEELETEAEAKAKHPYRHLEDVESDDPDEYPSNAHESHELRDQGEELDLRAEDEAAGW